MMIKAGNKEIPVKGVYLDTIDYAGSKQRALRLRTAATLSAAQIAALTTNTLALYDDKGVCLGKQEGYNTLAAVEVILAAVQEDGEAAAIQVGRESALRAELDAAKAIAEAKQAEAAALLAEKAEWTAAAAELSAQVQDLGGEVPDKVSTLLAKLED